MQDREWYKKQKRERQKMIRDAVRNAGTISEDILNAFIYGETTTECKMEMKGCQLHVKDVKPRRS